MPGGDSCVTGRCFERAIIFGEGEPTQIKLTSAGLRNIFIAKHDPDGALQQNRKQALHP